MKPVMAMLNVVNELKFADIEATKKRFLMINRERLRRAEGCMRPTQRDFLDFLPLLFHVNHPRLPGYVSKASPAGICDYTPTKRGLDAAKKYVQRFEYQKRALPRYDIVSMFLMGSSGTVAYSKKSDFDIWLCHQHDLAQERLAELQDKATAIEAWAEAQGLEVHFFLMDPVRFKRGEIVDLSSESSGTAQYYLLLEEFYRTGLLLAGRFPAWWLVPPQEEGNYDAYLKALFQRRLAVEGECVDFGGIPTLPAEEFFGAALWQLFKGIDSPYKSVLKLLLMEVYASEYPKIDLLCLRFKKAIFDNEIDLDRLDPYLMLYKKLEEYLTHRDEEERLMLVRRCFYFKVNQKLTSKPTIEYEWRRDLMRSLTNAWGWDEHDLHVMDNRSDWNMRRVLEERGILVRELTYTYQFLSDFARSYAQLAAINQQDLNALGRKLYAAFERKAGKVEIVNRGISQNVREANLTFYQIKPKGKRDNGWAILTDGVNDTKDKGNNLVALKRTRNLIEAMVWAHFNGLIDENSTLTVARAGVEQDDRELKDLERALIKSFPRQMVLETCIEDLGRAVRVLQCAIIVNLGEDLSHKEGRHLASNRTDAFSYGGLYECLVHSIDQVLVTSWKEVLTAHHDGVEGILTGISNYLHAMPPSRGNVPPVPEVFCFSVNHRMTIQQRIERLYQDIIDCFYRGPESQGNNYIFGVGHGYYVLYLEEDVLKFQRLGSLTELMAYLGRGRVAFGKVVLDRYALHDTLLPLMYKFNKPGVVQLFFKENGPTVEVYVIDERGSLFYEKNDSFGSDYLLTHYQSFFDSVLQRQYYQLADFLDEVGDGIDVEYFRFARDSRGQWQVRRSDPNRANSAGFFKLQVLSEEGLDGVESADFTVYCNDCEFSSLEYGDDLYAEVARHILARRKSLKRYPVFITDMDLPASQFSDFGNGQVPTVEFLRAKHDIETKLNSAVQYLAQSSATVSPIKPR